MSTKDTAVEKKKIDLSNLPNELTERGREICLSRLGPLSRGE
mgnify:CR=1 FL=1